MKPKHKPTLGILGAGKLGITLAQLARRAEYEVYIANSGSASTIARTVEILAPGAQARSAKEVARLADYVVLALPLSKFRQVPQQELAGKLVIDAMNYWWEVDGPHEDILPSSANSSSEAVQNYLEHSRVVKAMSHMGYHHLHDYAAPHGSSDRRAIALAGDNPNDIQEVSELIDALGFDPLPIGDLSAGRLLEPGHPAFGANLSLAELRSIIASPPREPDIIA